MRDEAPPVRAEDLFLSQDLTEEQAVRYLASVGLARPQDADRLLQGLAEDLPTREALAEIAAALLQAVGDAPDPDAALAGIAGYVERRSSRTGLLHQWRDDPRGLGVLAAITGNSPLLTQMLLRSPEYLPWLTALVDRPSADLDDLLEEIGAANGWTAERGARVEFVRRLQRRELLRTGTRELLGRDTVDATAAQLSTLADVVVADALRCAVLATAEAGNSGGAPLLPAIIATGDLGLQELGYAGTLDLAFVCDEHATARELDAAELVARATLDVLAESADESYQPRLEARLCRMDADGRFVRALSEYRGAYEAQAGPADRLLLAQSRFVTGNDEVGRRFIEWARDTAARGPVVSADALSLRLVDEAEGGPGRLADAIRRAPGGLDELRQLLQVSLLPESRPASATRAMHPRVELAALARNGVIAPESYDLVTDADAFLRRALHRLQLTAPAPPTDDTRAETWLAVCARSLGLPDGAALERETRDWRERVRHVPRGTSPATA